MREDFYLRTMLSKTALKFISGPFHILHGCCKTMHDHYRPPTARFLNSFIPYSIHALIN